MVSFQCEACGDVLTKPKLDKHGQSCRAAFTCIDCHTTFKGPAEYKSHTTCITEAEKYQKGLYKGQKNKNSHPRNHTNGNTDASPTGEYYYSQSPRYSAPTRAKPSWGRGWGQPRWEGTGANGIPLGSPARMPLVVIGSGTLPVQTSTPTASETVVKQIEIKKGKREGDTEPSKGEPPKKKKKINIATSQPAPAVPPVADVPPAEPKKKKSRKDKDVKDPKPANEVAVGDSTEIPPPADKGKKKRKRDKDGGDAKEVVAEITADSEAPPSADKEKKKKRKKVKEAKEAEPTKEVGSENAVPLTNKEKKKRIKDKKGAVEEIST